MIRSMTAFARKDTRGDWGTLTCEIRTVNHRYLEPSFRLPEAFRELENRFREELRKGLKRGKVRSEEHTSELQSRENLVCRLLLEKKKTLETHRHSPTVTN